MDKSFLKGMALGLLTGAVIGILFAPKSGKETRDDIKNFVIETKNKIADKLSHLKKISQEKYEQIVDETIDQNGSKMEQADIDQIKKEIKMNYDRIKKILEG